MNKISGIYKITNIINDHCYIGFASNITKRKNEHFYNLKKGIHGNNYFQNAYDKYGIENFEFEIIQELENDKELLALMEIYWIAYYNSFIDDRNGYNLTRGGEGNSTEISEKTRKKMSDSKKGNKYSLGFKHSEEVRERMSNAQKGKVLSEEHKQKVAIANTGKTRSEESRKRMSLAQKGKPKSEQAKKNAREARKPITDETREKMSESRKGRIVSDETRQKLSQSLIGNTRTLGYKHTEESKKKMSESRKGIVRSEEYKQKMSISLKESYKRRKQEQQENDLTAKGE